MVTRKSPQRYHIAWDFTLPGGTHLQGRNSDLSNPTSKDHVQAVVDEMNKIHGAGTHKLVKTPKGGIVDAAHIK